MLCVFVYIFSYYCSLKNPFETELNSNHEKIFKIKRNAKLHSSELLRIRTQSVLPEHEQLAATRLSLSPFRIQSKSRGNKSPLV